VNSRVDSIQLRGRRYFVKRDDLIDPLLSGNKYRKLYILLQTPAVRYRTIHSYGGSQSNAMLAIAALCHQKGWQFIYTSKTLASHIRQQPQGNLKQALALGMQLREVTHADYPAAIESLQSEQDSNTLLLAQGGADPMARSGLAVLAEEIEQWRQEQGIKHLHIVTPSGTGTTACYLATAMPTTPILTTAMVGDNYYLKQQIATLGEQPANLQFLERGHTYRFAKPYAEFLAIYKELLAGGIEFDLIYGAPMWHTLLDQSRQITGEILYIHSGGLSGNATMLDRYRHCGLLADT